MCPDGPNGQPWDLSGGGTSSNGGRRNRHPFVESLIQCQVKMPSAHLPGILCLLTLCTQIVVGVIGAGDGGSSIANSCLRTRLEGLCALPIMAEFLGIRGGLTTLPYKMSTCQALWPSGRGSGRGPR